MDNAIEIEIRALIMPNYTHFVVQYHHWYTARDLYHVTVVLSFTLLSSK